ncbi:MAG: energy transducer TonB [Pseudomonadota bacterium]
MRLGLPLSVALHSALAAGTLVVIPAAARESQEIVIVPVELVTVGAMTNVAAIVAAEPEPEPEEATEEIEEPIEDEPEAALPDPEEVEPESLPEAAPEPEPEPAPEPEPEPEDEPEEKPEPEEPPKPEPKPEEESQERLENQFDSILKTVEKKKTERKRPQKTADIQKTDDASQVRPGVGAGTGNTVDAITYIVSKIETTGCWRDPSDMPNAERLRATIRFNLLPDGSISGSPKLIQPPVQPMGDQPMRVFVQRAYRAIRKCAPYDQLPAEGYETWKTVTLNFRGDTGLSGGR